MILVDSSVWIDYLNDTATPQTEWLESALGRRPLCLTNLILCEVLQGIRHERRFRLAEELLLSLPVFDLAGTELSIAAARNYRYLLSRGVTVRKTIDCLIATFCIREELTLLHHDRDFDAFASHLKLKLVTL